MSDTPKQTQAERSAYLAKWKKANPDKVREYRKINYARNLEKRLAKNKARYYADRDRAAKANAEYRRKNPDMALASAARWRQANQHKIRVYRQVDKAIKSGELVVQPCEMCGTTDKIHAHHDDYDLPLNVMWLCPGHHKARHAYLTELVRRTERGEFKDKTTAEIYDLIEEKP